MRHIRKLIVITIIALLLSGLSLSSAGVAEVQALPPTANVVYNLYATDGYIHMADGTQQFIFGFVGGREGEPLTYQLAGPRVAPWSIATIETGSPAPTPGPGLSGDEAALFGNAQFPAPVIYAAVGDTVEIRLKNLGVSNLKAPNDPHSIHLHGLDVNAANDGVPETSLGAVGQNAGVPGAGNVVVYMFYADKPGTYMYHCHQEANIHVQMGMYGALVIYDPNDPAVNPNPLGGCPEKYDANGDPILCGKGPGSGQGGNLWGWDYDKDYILLLSEFDVGQHLSEEFFGLRGNYNSVNYKPQYWFINGLSFPNTIHAGLPPFSWANWIASHPGYDPFIVGETGENPGDPGQKVLLRVINLGFQTQPMHMHGFHGKIIGSDQRAWPWVQPGQPIDGAGTPGVGMEKNTLTVGSGETYAWLLDFGTWSGKAAGLYPAGGGEMDGDFPGGTQSKMDAGGVPVSNATTDPLAVPIPDPFVPPFTYIGGPTVGPSEPLDLMNNGVTAGSEAAHLLQLAGYHPDGQTTGQLFPFHNHDDYKATNNGVYPGGMFTMIMPVAPPPPPPP